MVLAITAEQEQLAEAVSRFAARHAPIDKTRAAFDSIAAGELPPWWEEFTAHGFHAVHVPEAAGGQGGTLADMACVIEAAAAALLPGPLLSTATTSAVASLADASAAALMADLAAGATAAVVLPEHSAVHAVRRGDGWCLRGSVRHDAGYLCSTTHPIGRALRQRRRTLVRARRAITRFEPQDRAATAAPTCAPMWARCTSPTTSSPRVRWCPGFPPSALGASRWPSRRARQPGRCAGVPTRPWTTSALANSSENRSAPSRRCSTRPRILLVNAELAAAAAWDAVRATDESVEQHRLAAAVGRPDGGGSRPGLGARRAADVRRDRLHVGTRHPSVLAPRHQPGRVAGADDAVGAAKSASWPAR